MDDSTDGDTYPMPLFPQLRVASVADAVAWYRALGFEVIFELPVMAHVRYRRYADVMLVEDRLDPHDGGDDPHGVGLTVYLTLEDETVDEVVRRAGGAGVEPVDGPRETGWNTVEAVFVDPDGYRFAFAEVADPTLEFDDVMDA